jgi:penicillin-binding protein 2
MLIPRRKKPERLAWFTLLATTIAISLSSNAAPPSPSLQKAVDRAMAGRAGALVVVDVVSGSILASHNLKAAGRLAERPGSTVKPFVLLALIKAGKLHENEKLHCQRPLFVGAVRMDCTHSPAITELDAEEALAFSCNSYFAQVSPRLSAAELVQEFRQAGLNAPTGLVNEEAAGRIDQPVNQTELQLEALGDRGIKVTPLELLEAYRKLALLKRGGDAGLYEPVFKGLEDSVTFGIAHAANVEGMSVAGKTGTASSQATARTHGFFAGYAPAEKPEIVMVVFLAQGRGLDAAAIAQPVFAEFAREKQKE